MVVCLVFDIDDTIYVHKSNNINYSEIEINHELKKTIEHLEYPKFVLTNATFDHANVILNKLDIVDEFKKIYSRDNIPEMKPIPFCYRSVKRDITVCLSGEKNSIIFFDDLLNNLNSAKSEGWTTIWISPNYKNSHQYPFIDSAFPTLTEALKKIK